ncbi:hypothetical protein B0H17DRAFT_566364 [Mycena rosella]|uniref:F-box domain-containing protein n=1 Tax=Mycena rosella TaxID=1033263 RepID=A0AAD7GJV0_MYCRO|nr:hypothetical protein B0H17DRAFT_566364 [Mycena rosella]
MDWIPESTTVDNLPDEVLAAILKLVADMPVPAWNRAAPFPIAAGRVDRRWRALVLGYPEFWTNIRIAHRSRSWIWAALFVKRSQSCLLDISINLQSYMYQPNSACVYKTVQPRGRAYIPMAKALAILGPHVGRWRTIVLRAWENQLCEFFDFLRRAPRVAPRIENLASQAPRPPWNRSSPLPAGECCMVLRSAAEVDC